MMRNRIFMIAGGAVILAGLIFLAWEKNHAQERRQVETMAAKHGDIKGPDADADGIRDDIDSFIARQTYTGPQRQAVRQLARSYQSVLTLKGDDPAAAAPLAAEITRSEICVQKQFSSPYLAAPKLVLLYRRATTNSAERMQAFARFDNAVKGHKIPPPAGEACETKD